MSATRSTRGATLVHSLKKTNENISLTKCERLNELSSHQQWDSAIATGLDGPYGEAELGGNEHKLTSLPPHLVPLKDIFIGLLSVYRMMRSRNIQTTFKSMKEGVENASKRRFEEKELYQLKTLIPHVLQIERTSDNIIIKLANDKIGADAVLCIEQALINFVSGQEDSQAIDVPMYSPTGDVVTDEKRLEFQSPKKKKQRRLSLLCPPKQDKTSEEQFMGKVDKACLMESLPGELRRRSLDGIISLESLHKLDSNEKEYHRLSGSEAKSKRLFRATISSLPDTFCRVRAIFGHRGPKVLDLDVLCDRMRSGGLETVSKDDIGTRIRSGSIDRQSTRVHLTYITFIFQRRLTDTEIVPGVCLLARPIFSASLVMATKTSLGKLLDPIIARFAPAYQAAVGKELKKYGLRMEDLYDPENDLDVEEALGRLPQEVIDGRNQRLKRAMDLSVKHSELPKELQDKQTPFAYYMKDTLAQIQLENDERELLDASRPNERHIP